MPEKKRLATLWAVTDCDTGMYSVGEVDGGFDREALRQHIKSNGSTGIVEQLAHMTHMAIDLQREINSEDRPQAMQAMHSPVIGEEQ